MDFASLPCTEGLHLCQITWPDGKSNSFDLNTDVPGVSDRTLYIPCINDKEILLYWENLSIPV